MALLPCFLVGHKPFGTVPYCRWCNMFLQGEQQHQEATKEATEPTAEDRAIVLDPDSPEFQLAQLRREQAEQARLLNPNEDERRA